MLTSARETKFDDDTPDPDTDTEVGQTNQQHDNVADEEHGLGALQSSVETVHVIVPNILVIHPSLLFHKVY